MQNEEVHAYIEMEVDSADRDLDVTDPLAKSTVVTIGPAPRFLAPGDQRSNLQLLWSKIYY